VRLASLPGCLWFDSAARGPRSESGDADDATDLGRYSFLMADPVETMEASVGQGDPWQKLDAWYRRLPRDVDSSLPPFQGGIAGLWGYEAATWLESVGVADRDDLPTPAISLGLYDWTIAMDHETNRAWLISQGFGSLASELLSPAERVQRAGRRADEVEQWLVGRPTTPNQRFEEPVQHVVTCDPQVFASQHETSIDGVRSNFTSQQYRAAIDAIVESIRRGDSFQVNLAQRLLVEASSSSPDLYLRLRRHNPAPFGAYYAGAKFQVLSSSPEGFLQVRNRHVETRPIKGTVPRTGDPKTDEMLAAQLLASEKDRAENVMIVDLLRNDLSRACTDDSVQVTKLWGLERYQYVQHLVSVVEGELAEGRTVTDLLRFCFPGGSVTGAPKIEAMKTIARLEPNRRGPYCGSMGYISCGGNADFNILIRTITASGGYWQIPVGGGITARSNAEQEEAETWAKAKGMLRAVRENPSS
jgi:para-aminobenzoate synthetase component 1